MTGGIEARRAIEALRAGVPNEAAVRALGTGETGIGSRFHAVLETARDQGELTATRGLLVSGGFGAGKSHLLGTLRLQALANNFVVSTVSISKETPLYDLRKVYEAAVRGASVPHMNEEVMRAAIGRLKPGDDAFAQLEEWTNSHARPVAPVFAAILHLLLRSSGGPELVRRFERFLSGAKLNKTVVRAALKDCGAAKAFDLKYSESAIALDLLAFAPRLMRAAGYRGWWILLDEVELIGRYSPLQRGKAYAELGRWLGLDAATAVEGLVTVAAITDDFASEVVVGKKDDRQMETRLANKGLVAEARRAGATMRAISQEAIDLRAPGVEALSRDLDRVRALYAEAYGWSPPALELGAREASRSIRSHIRSWITQWDILRIYGEHAVVETERLATNYDEARELEEQAVEDDTDTGDA